MFADLLSAHYDLYHPEYSVTLVNSLRSYINLKLDHEKKSADFITELRRKLYFIHEYNCQVAKATHEYPRSRKLDLLLIKYVELEFDVLYKNNYVSRQLEEAIELRVLRLLQVILYPAVLNNEPLINKHTDRALKKAVLQLLGEVRSTYLIKNRLVYNIAHKLLKRVGGVYKNHKSTLDIHKNLATSDYGSDDSDSEFENNIFFKESSARRPQSSVKDKTDCVEVPLTTNGQSPIPTIEFTDDDDYFVYLQKRISSKRKLIEDSKCRKKFFGKTKDANSGFINSNFKDDSSNKAKNILSASCVIVCSDSEDEVAISTNRKSPKKEQNVSNNRNIGNEQNIKGNAGIVTFEILDDDEEDGQTNYMVYLQKEVESRKNSKIEKINREQIIICSDSEDETSTDEAEKTQRKDEFTNLQKQSSSKIPTVPLIQAECIESSNNNLSINTSNANGNVTCDKNFAQNLSQSDSVDRENNVNLDSSLNHIDNGVVNPKQTFLTQDKMENLNPSVTQASSSQHNDIQMPSTSTNGNSHILTFSDDITNAETLGTNYLVDPSVILQQMTLTHGNPGYITKQLEVSAAEFDNESIMPGGPVMSEKVDGLDDLGNVSECRINESLLEELLLDDTYLLEGRKEFEELEYFLFNDSTEKHGFNLSNISFDNTETVLQPETFDADIKSLESFLNDSQLINWTHYKHDTSVNGFDSIIENNGLKNEPKSLNCDSSDISLNNRTNCKQGSNSRMSNEEGKRQRKESLCERKKYSKVTFKHPGRVSKR